MSLRYSNIRRGWEGLGDTFRGLGDICLGSPWLVRNACRIQTPLVMTPPTTSRPGPFGFLRVPSHLISGVRYGYPICCVLHFCWDNALGRAAGMTRWKQIRHERGGLAYVSCGLFHAGGSPLPLNERLRRMLSFEWAYLQPTKDGTRRREFVSQGGPGYRASTIGDRRRASDLGVLEVLWWAETDTNGESPRHLDRQE